MTEDAVDLLINSISHSTLRQYSKPIGDWVIFCYSRNIEIFKPQDEDIIHFLTDKFNNGANYSTLNTARSALSLICVTEIGKNPLISRLLKGAYNLKPAKPRYDRVFSLDPVLEKLELLSPLNDLDLPALTTKLAVLLALITAHRIQTIASIKRCNILKRGNNYEIEISDKIKTSRRGVSQPLLLLPKFLQNSKLCIVLTLEKYLEKTSDLIVNPNKLFITTVKPFKEASKDTVSRWIRSFLQSCVGNDFTSHSLRHASTSTAFKKGVNLDIIKNLAGWSDKSKTFEKFYNRPIIPDKNTFAETILS